jgi:hypothetical protein
MAGQLRARADDDRFRSAPHFDGIVRDEAMAADDQVERAFALADAALADDQHAEAEDVDQHAVNDFAVREAILEHRGQLADRRRGRHRRPQNWHVGALALRDHFRRDLRAAGDQQARQVRGETLGERFAARRGIEALEKAHLAFAEQQDAAGLQVFMEPREREAGLLNVRTCNLAVESAGARQQLDGQAYRLGSRIEQPANGDGRSHVSRIKLFFDSRSESSALRGTSRSCAGPASGLRAAGC